MLADLILTVLGRDYREVSKDWHGVYLSAWVFVHLLAASAVLPTRTFSKQEVGILRFNRASLRLLYGFNMYAWFLCTCGWA